jgi:Secretion system C-terminal sorting domain/PKD-like domain
LANEALSGSQFNIKHILFTARNAEWLFREMQNDQPNMVLCSALTECLNPADIAIQGPATVCGPATYSLPFQGNGLTYSWTASPASLFTTATGTGPTFTTSNAGNGQGTITVTVSGACPFTFTRSVSVGAPPEFGLDGPGELTDCDPAGTYQITPFDPSLQYTITSSGRVRHRTLQSTGRFQVFAQATGTGEVRVTAANACGTRLTSLRISVTSCGYTYYSVYPNPAQDEATVQATDAEATAARSAPAGQPAEAPEFEVTLYNGQGRVVYQGRSQGRRARLPLRQLPAGLYQLHAGQGAQQERHTLQVTH